MLDFCTFSAVNSAFLDRYIKQNSRKQSNNPKTATPGNKVTTLAESRELSVTKKHATLQRANYIVLLKLVTLIIGMLLLGRAAAFGLLGDLYKLSMLSCQSTNFLDCSLRQTGKVRVRLIAFLLVL